MTRRNRLGDFPEVQQAEERLATIRAELKAARDAAQRGKIEIKDPMASRSLQEYSKAVAAGESPERPVGPHEAYQRALDTVLIFEAAEKEVFGILEGAKDNARRRILEEERGEQRELRLGLSKAFAGVVLALTKQRDYENDLIQRIGRGVDSVLPGIPSMTYAETIEWFQRENKRLSELVGR